jgi:hypothetical protein
MTFDVEVVLKGRDYAVTEKATVEGGEPASWSDPEVRDVLIEILRAIDKVENPDAAEHRMIALRGFSWIVEPEADKVVIAIEIPSGAAIAGPFAIDQAKLDAIITRVLVVERQLTSPQTVH